MADNWWEDTSWMDGIEDDTSFLDDDTYGSSSDWWNDTSWMDDDNSFLDMFDDTNTYGSDNYNYNFDDIFSADDIDMDSDWWNDDSWMDGIEDDTSFLDFLDDKNWYGADQDMSNITYEDMFDEEGNFTGYNYESPFTPGEDEESGGGGILEFFNKLFGNIGQNPNRSGNQMGGIGQYLGDFLSSPLAQLLLLKEGYGERKKDLYIPKGQEAYGSGAGVGSLPDYRISNIQPALLPGMAYANQPTTFNNTPPGMQAGGIASLENRMDGPGDITQAMLEPGEFVMTRKATENLTPEYLYDLMHQAENAGRMT